jgi:hypothetical protein
MSPDLVDQAILACCKPQFHKVARILTDVAKTLKVEIHGDRSFDFIVDRIKALVEAGHLESQGDLDQWRYSEVCFPAPPLPERH